MIWRNTGGDKDTTSHFGTSPNNRVSTKNGRSRVDHHIILKSGVTMQSLGDTPLIILGKTASTKGHSLIDLAAVAYANRFPDDNSGSMINEK